MKAYLLLCFFLLFHLINSNKRDTVQNHCDQQRNSCMASFSILNKKFSSLYSRCELRCRNRYINCLYGAPRQKFGSYSK